jgi:hypothetical protein
VRKYIERSKASGQLERSQGEQIRLARSKEQDLEAAKDRNSHGFDTKGEGGGSVVNIKENSAIMKIMQ